MHGCPARGFAEKQLDQTAVYHDEDEDGRINNDDDEMVIGPTQHSSAARTISARHRLLVAPCPFRLHRRLSKTRPESSTWPCPARWSKPSTRTCGTATTRKQPDSADQTTHCGRENHLSQTPPGNELNKSTDSDEQHQHCPPPRELSQPDVECIGGRENHLSQTPPGNALMRSSGST